MTKTQGNKSHISKLTIRDIIHERRKILFWLLVICSVTFMIFSGLNLFYFSNSQITGLVFLAIAILSLGLIWINRLGFYTQAAIALMVLIISGLTFNLIYGNGMRDSGIVAFPIVIMMGGLLFGKRSIILFTALTITSAVLVTLLEQLGIVNQNQNQTTDYVISIVIIILIISSGIISSIIMQNYESFIKMILQKSEQLEHMQKIELIGALSSGIIHDVNNSMTAISGVSSIMRHNLSNMNKLRKEDITEMLDTMDESNKRIQDTMLQLQALSKKQDQQFVEIDLRVPVTNIIKLCGKAFDNRIEITESIPEKPIMVNADQSQIEQTLLNICINASHAMIDMQTDFAKQGGKLSVTIKQADKFSSHLNIPQHCKTTDSFWKISVTDSGIGMNNTVLLQLFEPFFTIGKDKGTGLGMTMVYSVMAKHGGGIDVISKPGEGTTIDLYLPAIR